jgi:polyhydroxybutyrate depolymerase
MIPDGCDDPNATNTPMGFTPSATAWAQRNGCGTATTTTPVQNGTCSYYQGCPADGQVAICILSGMKHCWSGGPADAGDNACPGWASATQLEWAFFKKYAW